MPTDPSQVVDVAHRGGRRTSFIPPLTGPRAPWDAALRTLNDPIQRGDIAARARATIRWLTTEGQSIVRGVSLQELGDLVPDELLAVRRPPSFVGQQNYISVMAAPTRSGEPRAVWCESFAELAHARDLLLGYDVEQFVTQPFRLEWTFPTGGLRVHVPDLLIRTRDQQVLVVDVSTQQRVANPKARAMFALTHATCEALGWRYELRTKMSPQRVRNVQFVYSFCALEPVRSQHWRHVLHGLNGGLTIHRLAIALGAGAWMAGLPGVWWLLARGAVSANLSDPLRPDSVLLNGRMGTPSADWLVLA